MSATPCPAGDEASRPSTPVLRVMTYNVRYFGHATRGIATTSAAIHRIARSLAHLSPLPDLICLQEVETQSLRSSTMNPQWHPEETQLERLMLEFHAALAESGRTERYFAYYFPAHTYRLTMRTNIYTTGLAVIARDTLQVDHHNATQPHDITFRRRVRRLKQTRICAHVSFRHPSGQTLDIFNTHLSLPSVFSREFWTGQARMGFGPNQLEEARVLANFIQQEQRSPLFVVVGDFNALPGSPVDRYLREEAGLVDAFSRVQRVSVEEARAFPTAGFMNLRMHLDHVYSSPGLEWLDFEGTHAFGRRGAFAGLSDHVPLIGRCRVPAVEALQGTRASPAA
ncbi:endonuclease/exonuclease/phosphatase family protein [Chondromyces crocatus]|uniref:Endonuclease n=1 Tax=Chondromyces crocatus TaxID=52 RepID=A0A0K1ER58_CHOCO|nr:endonuclease/exonuclease/phosphatase family protein [Chondromyces crocatus]AKT43420.1 endonuclease [Chondromyces crocatus]